MPRKRQPVSESSLGVASRCRQFRMAPALSCLRDTRCFVDEVARDAGLSDARSYDLKVAVCEAAANAVEHAGGLEQPVEICARLHADRLQIEVVGRGEFVVRADPETERVHRGHGLALMVALCDEVCIRRRGDGGTSVTLTMFFSR